MVKTKGETKIVVPSSGNVFADLGLSNPDEKQTKVRLALAINQIIGAKGLSQAAAARSLEVNQPKISALRNYQLAGFSVERLMNFLTALDRDVEIVIRQKPKSRRAARILVTAA
ncbi:MAG TPA: helix-turn-helix transcriptional regulator [Candidatus Acidoferrum sp.]|jgi:predicted XRE-type DNA-binding protein